MDIPDAGAFRECPESLIDHGWPSHSRSRSLLHYHYFMRISGLSTGSDLQSQASFLELDQVGASAVC
jgi:hypothetical protein